MDDKPPQENPKSDFNKLDLTQLQGFSFGTQWTQDKSSPGDARRDDRPRREGGHDRRDDRAAPDRRDRRAFKKPVGGPVTDAPAHEAGAPGADPRGPRRESFGGGGGGPRRDRGEFRGGPGGDRGPRFGGRGEPQMERGPYDSPYFAATFYPEDISFATLAKTIRASCRTFELFDIAKTVIAKPDRFVVVLQRKPAGGEAGAKTGEGGKAAPLAISVPDGLPFESEEAAIAHVMSVHLNTFFDTSEVEIEAPKGNYQVINKCGVTGELLGPPNYHRYNQIVQQHHAARVARMPFEMYRSRIETVRDPEVVNQWLEKMKKATRYTWKLGRSSAPAPAPAPEAAPAAEGEAPAPAAAEAPPPLTFDNLEDARMYLLTHAREKVVRLADSARFHGKAIESLPQGEIRRAVEGTVERQRRFPLDTANALRGRLRREGFTIFKKGSKGVSYVCAVKRKFRVPGQVFAESIGSLISFVEAHPMVKASELPAKFLGLSLPAAPAPAAEGAAAPAPEAAPVLTVEQREKMARMQGDLVWLVREGYVTEFIDGRLFAPPPMVEARKKEIESGDHDPENFPEAPSAPEAAAPAESRAAEPAETEASAPESDSVEAASAAVEPVEQAENKPAAPATS